jgi:hypothetical protein
VITPPAPAVDALIDDAIIYAPGKGCGTLPSSSHA